jgi:hypothetical protein
LTNKYRADRDKWDTNAEIFEDLQKRLKATVEELKSIRSDIEEQTDAMMNEEEIQASTTYEIKGAVAELRNSVNLIESVGSTLNYFEDRYNEDYFYEGE